MPRNVEVKADGIKKLVLSIKEALSSTPLLQVIGQYSRDRIYQNTKRGFYAGTRKNLAKLKPLTDGYVKYRKSLLSDAIKSAGQGKGRKSKSKSAKIKAKAAKKFGPFFSPARSNLTLSGEMLEALTYRLENGKIVIEIENSQRSSPYDDERLTNREVAAKVIKDGRPFLRLDDRGVDIIRRSIVKMLRRALKNR